MPPVTPRRPHLPPQAVPLGEDLLVLVSQNLPGKSTHFVIPGRIENKAPGGSSQA